MTLRAARPNRREIVRYQAIPPLRGKILNTWKSPVIKCLAQRKFLDIAVALGIDPDNEDLSQLRYGKSVF